MTQPRIAIDIWSDIACPWCFIGKRRFEKALEAFPHKEQVDVTWHAFQLDPSLPERYDGTEEEYLAQVKGMAPEQVRQMLGHVAEQAAGEGLAYDFDHLHPANSFTALRLLALAKARGLGSEMKETLLSAHFEKALDVGDRAVLQALAEEAGLPADEAARVLASDGYADDVHADIARARALGITGVPFFVLENKYGVSGAQPSEVFAEALAQVWQESAGSPLAMVATGADGETCGPDGCS